MAREVNIAASVVFLGCLLILSLTPALAGTAMENSILTVEQIAKVLDRADHEASQATMLLKATEMVSAEFDYEANNYGLFKDARALLEEGKNELALAHESFQQSLAALKNKEPYVDLLRQTQNLCLRSLEKFEDAKVMADAFLEVIIPDVPQEVLEIEERQAKDALMLARAAINSNRWLGTLPLFSLKKAEAWHNLSMDMLGESLLPHFRVSKAAADEAVAEVKGLRARFVILVVVPTLALFAIFGRQFLIKLIRRLMAKFHPVYIR